jgi:hypothetical protein
LSEVGFADTDLAEEEKIRTGHVGDDRRHCPRSARESALRQPRERAVLPFW